MADNHFILKAHITLETVKYISLRKKIVSQVQSQVKINVGPDTVLSKLHFRGKFRQLLQDYPPSYSELIIKTSFEKDLMQILLKQHLQRYTVKNLTALSDRRKFVFTLLHIVF